MRIILLITVCNQNRARILHQVNNINLAVAGGKMPDGLELIPVFVFGQNSNPNDVPPIHKLSYESIVVDAPERYDSLYLKLFRAYEYVDTKYTYDFIWKIDDDTLINFDKLNLDVLRGKDWVGRFFNGFTNAKIRIDLDFCKIHKDILFKPPFFDTQQFKFATGDCYFLSPKAVAWIRQQRHLLKECEGHRINEDRLFGYMVDNKDLVTEDINLMDDFVLENDLQITREYLTIHPISSFIFTSLMGVPVEEQLKRIEAAQSVNLLRRRAYAADLEAQIKRVVYDFINSKKSIGMG